MFMTTVWFSERCSAVPSQNMRLPSHVPFHPARFPVFYGWLILFAGSLGIFMSIPGQTMGVSVFTDPLLDVLGITRDELSLAYMLGTIGSSFLLPFAGKKYDQWGARTLALASSIGLGLILLILSQIDVLIFEVLRLSSPAMILLVMTFGFLCLRFCGQGVLTMTSRNMMMEWFDQRRGLATGFSNVFVSLAFSVSPIWLFHLISSFSWDGAWMILALIAGVVFPGFVFLIFRDKPEDSGLKPDGNFKGTRKTSKHLYPVIKPFTRYEALRNYAFWVFALLLAMQGLYITGFTFHVISIFQENGLTEQQAITIFVPSAVIAVGITLVASIISDHVPLKYLAIIKGAGACLGIVGFIFLGEASWAYYLVIVGNGIMTGLFAVLASVSWPRYFGRLHLGAITGQVTSMMVFASALGPILFSTSLTAFGSYQTAGWICLAIFATLAFGAVKAENPQKDLQAQEV